MGCTPSAPHQCPLESVISYLIYADVRNLNETPGVETKGARLLLLPRLVALITTLEEVNGGGGGGAAGGGDGGDGSCDEYNLD